MSLELIHVQRQDARFRHGKFCRLLSEAINGKSDAIAHEAGIYPSQLRAYASLHECETNSRRQPFYTADRILIALMEERGEAGRLAGIEIVSMLCETLGGSFVPTGLTDPKAINEELAEKATAAARVDVATLRECLGDGHVSQRDAEIALPLIHAEMVECAELAQAIKAAAGAAR